MKVKATHNSSICYSRDIVTDLTIFSKRASCVKQLGLQRIPNCITLDCLLKKMERKRKKGTRFRATGSPVFLSMRILRLQGTNLTSRFPTGILPSRRIITSSNSCSSSKNETSPVKPYKDIPGPRGIDNIPILGLLLKMKPFGKYSPETFPYYLNELVEQYGPILRLHTNHPSVVITDPKDIAMLVRSEGKYPCRPALNIYKIYTKRTGSPSNLTDLQGESWWHLRAPMQKAMLKPSVMPQYLPEMNRVADDLVDMIAEGYLQNHDPEQLFMAYTAESVGDVCFNKRLGFLGQKPPQKMKDIQQAISDIFEILHHTATGASNAYKLYRSKEYRKFEATQKFLSQTMSDILTESIKDLSKKKVEKNNFLDVILKNTSFEEARMIMEASLFGAVESSAAAMQAFLHTLGINQDKQEKLQAELRGVLGNHYHRDRPITTQDIRDMPYLRSCVKEMYRMCPIAPSGIIRFLPKDVVFSGYRVPAGVQVYAHAMKTCQNADFFKNPDKFLPERWFHKDDDNNDTNVNLAKKWAVIPFGMGARSCPGRRLFEQELYVVMAKLFRRLKVGVEPESQDVGFEYRMFRRPCKPIKFTFSPVD